MSAPSGCRAARSALWPPERPRLCRSQVEEAWAHVESCPSCRAFFQQDRVLLEAFRRLGREEAPARVREAVFDLLARERVTAENGRAVAGRRDRLGWIAGGGLIGTALLGGAMALGLGRATGPRTPPASATSEASEPVGAVFVEDYLRRAVGEERIESSDAAEVSRFLTRELGLPVSPLFAARLVIEKAEVCLLKGRRGGVIVYRDGDRAISHYIIPRYDTPGAEATRRPNEVPGEVRDAGEADPRVRLPAPSPRLQRALREDGMPRVVTWATVRLEHALVGPVPAARLMALADGTER